LLPKALSDGLQINGFHTVLEVCEPQLDLTLAKRVRLISYVGLIVSSLCDEVRAFLRRFDLILIKIYGKVILNWLLGHLLNLSLFRGRLSHVDLHEVLRVDRLTPLRLRVKIEQRLAEPKLEVLLQLCPLLDELDCGLIITVGRASLRTVIHDCDEKVFVLHSDCTVDRVEVFWPLTDVHVSQVDAGLTVLTRFAALQEAFLLLNFLLWLWLTDTNLLC